MELGAPRGGVESLSPEQMREQMETARRQMEFYENQHAEWEKQQSQLNESREHCKEFETELNRVGTLVGTATERLKDELESMEREHDRLARIHGCLSRHLTILSSLRPQECPPEHFRQYVAETLPKLLRAEDDFHEAYYGAENYRHTKVLLDKPGEERKSEFNWSVLRLELAKGLAFHLPLFLLLLLTWLIYLAVITF